MTVGGRPPDTEEMLSFLRGLLLPLADVRRTMVIPGQPERRENVAEHSFFLAGLACALAGRVDPGLDVGLVAQFALVHDMVEARTGDVSVWAPESELRAKRGREEVALADLLKEFGPVFDWFGRTLRDYETLTTPESRFVYALDKIVPHAMVVLGNHHPVRPTRRDYDSRVRVARAKVARFPALLPYFDDLCAVFDASPHFFGADDGA